MNHAVTTSGAIQRLQKKSLVAAALAGAAGLASAAPPEHESPLQLVQALHSAFGEHHARAVHAKGIVLEGEFEPAPTAHLVSRSTLFTNGTLPVTVRFSDFTGIPDIPDTVGDANPRGFALKFHLPDGSEADVVTHSFNGFPTATSDEFAQFLRAIGASGPEAPKPTAIERFLETHPIAKAFLSAQKPPPESYATAAYFGVNSFRFSDGKDKISIVRYRFVPESGEHYLDAAQLRTRGPDYLAEEIANRVKGSPIRFSWFAQIAEPKDATENPSIAWPENRHLVKLGVVTIKRVAVDQVKSSRELMFLPARVPAGIEPADPMIAIRQGAYPISFGGRQ